MQHLVRFPGPRSLQYPVVHLTVQLQCLRHFLPLLFLIVFLFFVARPASTKPTGTRVEAGKATDADMIRAREKLVGAPQMNELLNMVDAIEADDPKEVRNVGFCKDVGYRVGDFENRIEGTPN